MAESPGQTTTLNMDTLGWIIGIGIGIFVLIMMIRSGASNPESQRPAADRVSEALGGWALSNQAMQYAAAGQFTKAESMHKQAIEMTERDLGPMHKNLALCYNNLAGCYDMQRRPQDARPLFEKSLEIWRQTSEANSLAALQCQRNLAGVYSDLGRIEDADAQFRDVLQRMRATLSGDDSELALTLNNYGAFLCRRGTPQDIKEAKSMFQEALRIWEKTLDPQHQYIRICRDSLSQLAQQPPFSRHPVQPTDFTPKANF